MLGHIDLVAAIKDMFALRVGCWNLLVFANVVLIEKKAGQK
jgi:hypothetical protein